jgi:hypothetical protein
MESNIKIKDTPKLKISSAVFGDKDIAGDSTGSIRNIHKTLSKLSGHVRKSLIRIKGLEEKFSKVEKKIEVNSEKITRIKKVLQTQKGNIGKKLPGGSNVNQSLVETNRILVEIQKQITTAFGMRNEEEKEKNKTLKQEKYREKLRLKEGAIESVRKIGGTIKKTVGGLLKPVEGIFDKIMEFLSILGTGIAANAVFGWLSDEENKSKLMGWFDFIKEHWKWGLAALGGIALLNIVGPISAVLGVISGAVGLLAKGIPLLTGLLVNPLFLKAMLAIGAGILIYKGGEFLLNKTRDAITGGEDFSAANDVLDKELRDSGMDMEGKSFSGTGRSKREKTLTPEQIKVRDSVMRKREDLKELRKLMDEEIKEKKGALEIIPTPKGRKPQGYVDPNTAPRKKVETEVRENYGEKIRLLLEQKEMGGPVSAKTPYLVGESGPEIFAPNVDGSIINNMRTEKIYQMISSKDAGKINFITMELPPKVMKKEQQDSTQQTAPPVPSISPVNGSNPYMNITPEIYGIYV